MCGKSIQEEEVSIDHVIPWSYLYSDDVWNLVYVHKSCNSSKSNVFPTKDEIEKLKARNNRLFKQIIKEGKNGKVIDELSLAIEKDYVNKFWIGCKS